MTLKKGTRFRITLPIAKIDEERREVSGYATAEEIDKQGEIVTFEASKAAFERWTDAFEKATDGASLGNIREMHGPTAAGKVLSWGTDEEKKAVAITGKIVDAEAWEKTRERVYTGFSIGGDVLETDEVEVDGKKVRRIKSFDLVEVSLVDNPACPSATFTVVKRTDGTGDVPEPEEDPKPEDEPKPEPEQEPEAPVESKTVRRGRLFTLTPAQKAAGYSLSPEGEAVPPETPEPEQAPEQEQEKEEEVEEEDSENLDDLPPLEGEETVKAVKADGMVVQTLIFDSSKFTVDQAKAWANSHGYESPKVDETEGSFRLRQRDPGDFVSSTFRTIELKDGIKAVVGRLKIAAPGFAKEQTVEAIVAGVLEKAGIVKQDEAMANLATIHKIGHALVKATSAMGAECVDKICPEDKAEGLEEEEPEAETSEEESAPDEEEEPPKKRPPFPPKKVKDPGEQKKQEGEERLPVDRILDALSKVREEVASLAGATKSLDARLGKIEKSPAGIGKALRPAEKVLGAGNVEAIAKGDEVEILKRLAETETNPEVKRSLLYKAAMLEVRKINSPNR